MRLNNDTRLVVLLGKPLGQSLSVRLHNTAYENENLNLVYLAEEIEREDLGPVLGGLRRMNFAGCGVTKPYKVDVMEFLDEIDPLCEKIGSCNTVVCREGKLVGYNTDAEGFYRSLTQDGGVRVEGASFFCIGAGGAGRAMCAALANHGAGRIYVADVVSGAAEALCGQLNQEFSPIFTAVKFGDWDAASSCTAILNASGVGMGHSVGQSPIPMEFIRPGQFCFDACYNPEKTRFLLDAEEQGAQTLNGLGMLLHQAVAQIELWSDRKFQPEFMRREILELAAGKE